MTSRESSEGDKGRQIEEQGKAGREIGRQVRTVTEVQGERDKWMAWWLGSKHNRERE